MEQPEKITILLATIFCVILVLIIPNIPYTSSQFYAQNTDLNYTFLLNGDYDGLCAKWDGNKITAGDCLTVDMNLPFANCGTNQATKIDHNTFICVNLPIDTNTVTAHWTSINGTWFDLNATRIDTNLIVNDSNKSYGIKYCQDGNIVVGYLVGYSC